MNIRALFGNAAYDTVTLRVMTQAFDDAWDSIAGNFGEDAQSVGTARLKLANAILSAAKDHSCDILQLKNAALQIIALEYRTPPRQRTTKI